jgi:hypothetical protein
LAVRDGDRIGALRGSVREPPVAPAGGPRGALRVLDALVRWYAAPPPDDAGLDVALDHARRLLKPGSRLLVLADAASIAAIPASRWPALATHCQVRVLLLSDPLERAPPSARLPFRSDGQRIELDLAAPAARVQWHRAFVAPIEAAIAQLPARGVHVQLLSSEMPSDAWVAGTEPRAA